MDSFDSDSLESEALDWALAFLNPYNVAPPLDSTINDFESLREPARQWPLVENLGWQAA